MTQIQWQDVLNQLNQGPGAGGDYPLEGCERPPGRREIQGWRLNRSIEAAGADVIYPRADWAMAAAMAAKLARSVERKGRRVSETTIDECAAAGHAAVVHWRAGVSMPGEEHELPAAGVCWRAVVAELDRDQYGRGAGLVEWDDSTALEIAAIADDSAARRRLQVGEWLHRRRVQRRPSKLNGLRSAVETKSTAGLNERSKARRLSALGRAFRAVSAIAAGRPLDEAAMAEGFKASGNRGGAGDALADYLARLGVYDPGFQWGVAQGKVRCILARSGPVAGDRLPGRAESVRELMRQAARARLASKRAAARAAAGRPESAAVSRVWIAGAPWVRPGGRAWQGFDSEPAAVRVPESAAGRVGGRAAAVQWRRPSAAGSWRPGTREIDARAEYVLFWQSALGLLCPVRYDGKGGVLGDIGRKLSALRAVATVGKADRRARVFVGRLRQRSVK